MKGKKEKVVCGSTNFSWRGFYVQANNAVVLQGKKAVDLYSAAFENYWSLDPHNFGTTDSAKWADLGLPDVRAQVAFSPHSSANALLQMLANDIAATKSSLLLFARVPLRDARTDSGRHQANDAQPGSVCLRHLRQKGWWTRRADAKRQRGAVFPDALGKDAPKPF